MIFKSKIAVCNKPRVSKQFQPMKVFHSAITLVQAVFIETLTSALISMQLFELFGYLNDADKFSMIWQMICLIILVLFVVFTLVFTFSTIPKIVIKHLAKDLDMYFDKLEEV